MANRKDFATSLVATAPSPATSGTSLVVTAGHGARFPAATFWATIHPADELPTLDNGELVSVTAVSTDTFTIVRAQGDTTAKSVAVGWRISNVIVTADIPATSSLSATGMVSLSTNGSTISIGVADKTFSNWEYPVQGNNTTFSSMGQNTLYIQKLKPEVNYSFQNFELKMSGSYVSSSNSQLAAHSIRYGLYSMDTNSSYNSIATSLMAMSASFNSTTAMGFTVSQGAGSHTRSSNNTVLASVYSGLKQLYLPFAGSMSAGGSYAFAYHISSATTVNTAPMRMAILQHTMLNNLTIGKIYASTALVSNASYVGDYAQGVLTATTSAMPSAIAESQMSNQVSQARVYLQLDS
jgi:hypothetical protein